VWGNLYKEEIILLLSPIATNLIT